MITTTIIRTSWQRTGTSFPWPQFGRRCAAAPAFDLDVVTFVTSKNEANVLRPCGVVDDDEMMKISYDVVPYVASSM
jgi:hypothetical protein